MKNIYLILISLLILANGYGQTFSEGLASKKLNKKWGFIDKAGNEVIPFKYDNANDFSEGLASVKLNGKWGFIEKTGKEVIPFKYDDAYSFSEGLVSVTLNKKYGFVDKTGNEVVPFKYDDAYRFSEGFARVKLGGKWGFIDKIGKEIIPFKYNGIYGFSEGLASVKLSGLWGFIDTTGKEVVPLKYEAVNDFSEGLASVKLNGVWFYITKTGNEVNKIIWKSLEGSTIKKINDYRLELYNDYRLWRYSEEMYDTIISCQINRPYLAISTGINLEIDTEKDISMLKYSGKYFDEKSINEVKTIIIVYDYLGYGFAGDYKYLENYKDYENLARNSNSSFSVKNYSRVLIYYDVDKKECIGYDIISVVSCPQEVLKAAANTNEVRISENYIIHKIESQSTVRISK